MAKANPAHLLDVVRAAAAKVRRYKDRRLGEQNTKTALIEPILEALGWDVHDPDEVHQEFRPRSRDNPVDNALKLMRQPRLFVEAKGLGENIQDHKWIAQVLAYATIAGVEWCMLSDGDEFRFYNAMAPVYADEKLFCRVTLSIDPPEQVAQILDLVSRANLQENNIDRWWKAHFIDRRVKAALEDMFQTVEATLIRTIRRKTKNLGRKDVLESLRRLDVGVSAPSPTLTPVQKPRTPTAVGRGLGRKERAPFKRSADTISLAQIIAADILKPPLRPSKRYKGKDLYATLLSDGSIEFQSAKYGSCSTAAEVARSTVTGRPMATNGWEFWHHEQNGKRVPLKAARAMLKRQR